MFFWGFSFLFEQGVTSATLRLAGNFEFFMHLVDVSYGRDLRRNRSFALTILLVCFAILLFQCLNFSVCFKISLCRTEQKENLLFGFIWNIIILIPGWFLNLLITGEGWNIKGDQTPPSTMVILFILISSYFVINIRLEKNCSEYWIEVE